MTYSPLPFPSVAGLVIYVDREEQELILPGVHAEEKRVLYSSYPDKRSRQIGTVLGLDDFSRMMAGSSERVRSVHTLHSRMVWFDPEFRIVIHVTITLPRPHRYNRVTSSSSGKVLSTPESNAALDDDSLISAVELAYRRFRLLHGSIRRVVRAGDRDTLAQFWGTWMHSINFATTNSQALQRLTRAVPAGFSSTSLLCQQLEPLFLQFHAARPHLCGILMHKSDVVYCSSVQYDASDLVAAVAYARDYVASLAATESSGETTAESQEEENAGTTSSLWDTYTLGVGSYLAAAAPPKHLMVSMATMGGTLPSLSLPSFKSDPAASPVSPAPDSPVPPTSASTERSVSAKWGLKNLNPFRHGSHSRSASQGNASTGTDLAHSDVKKGKEGSQGPEKENIGENAGTGESGSIASEDGEGASAEATTHTSAKQDTNDCNISSAQDCESGSLSGSQNTSKQLNVDSLDINGAGSTALTSADLSSSGGAEYSSDTESHNSDAVKSALGADMNDDTNVGPHQVAEGTGPSIGNESDAGTRAGTGNESDADTVEMEVDDAAPTEQAKKQDEEETEDFNEKLSGLELTRISSNEQEKSFTKEHSVDIYYGEEGDTKGVFDVYRRGDLTLALITDGGTGEDDELFRKKTSRLLEASEALWFIFNETEQPKFEHRTLIRRGNRYMQSSEGWLEEQQQWSGKPDNAQERDIILNLLESRSLHEQNEVSESYVRLESQDWALYKSSEDELFLVLPAKIAGKETSILAADDQLKALEKSINL